MSEAIKKIIEERDMFARMLGMVIEEADIGYARVSMALTKNHCNGVGMAHGGAIFSLADVAFGAAANGAYDHAVVTLSSNIIFLQPGRVSPLVAEARVIRRGAHIANYDVIVRDGAGTEVARSQSSGFLTDIKLNMGCEKVSKDSE